MFISSRLSGYFSFLFIILNNDCIVKIKTDLCNSFAINGFIQLIQNMYTYTWKKYLPVIRILLKKAADSEQTVNLNRTDFEKTTKLRKPVVAFTVDVVKGRLNPLNKSVPARDLIEILQEDETTRSLMRQNQYTISLNSDFTLSIKNITPDGQADSETEETPE